MAIRAREYTHNKASRVLVKAHPSWISAPPCYYGPRQNAATSSRPPALRAVILAIHSPNKYQFYFKIVYSFCWEASRVKNASPLTQQSWCFPRRFRERRHPHSGFSFPLVARSAWRKIRHRPTNQHSEQQGMVLVHMGTRPARASLICMARAWLATLLSRDLSCQSRWKGRVLLISLAKLLCS